MRDLFERHHSVRVAVVAVSVASVLALVQAAAASNALDMREVFRTPAPETVAPQEPVAAVRVSRPQATVRPPRLAARHPHDDRQRTADRRKTVVRLAVHQKRPLTIHLAALPPSRDTLFAPMPQRPEIVSIYEDQTLRRGDAVMMREGLSLFSGAEVGRHRPGDFVPFGRAANLDWHLRKTLSAFDNNPPDRWRT